MDTSVFSVLAGILGVLGFVTLLWGVFMWNALFLLTGGFGLLSSYAWAEVASLAERLEQLEAKKS